MATATENGKKAPTVTLRNEHDFSLNVTALELRVDELKKLAKKNREESYIREARAIEADAASIEHFLIPQFRGQLPLALVSTEQLSERIGAALRDIIRKALAGTGKGIEVNVRIREDDAVQELGYRISTYATELAEGAFQMGYQAREAQPEVIANRFVTALSRDA